MAVQDGPPGLIEKRRTQAIVDLIGNDAQKMRCRLSSYRQPE
jgi:hypothetical protein